MARPHCLRLFRHWLDFALALALERAGMRMDARMAKRAAARNAAAAAQETPVVEEIPSEDEKTEEAK